MGRRLLRLGLVTLLALVLGYLAALGIGLVAFDVFKVSQREGASAMGLVFFICPLVAVISALIAAIWYWVVSGRRVSPAGFDGTEAPRSNGARVLQIVAAIALGWLSGELLQWMLAGRSYDTFIVAFAVSMAPWIGAVALGSVTWWLTRPHQTAA